MLQADTAAGVSNIISDVFLVWVWGENGAHVVWKLVCYGKFADTSPAMTVWFIEAGNTAQCCKDAVAADQKYARRTRKSRQAPSWVAVVAKP